MSTTKDTNSRAAGVANDQADGRQGDRAEENDFGVADARLAYERIRPRLGAIPASAVRRFRANVPQSVANAFRAIRSFNQDRPLFDAQFSPGRVNLKDLEDLPDRAMALWYADVMLRQAMDPDAGVMQALLKEGKALQKKLRIAAAYIWRGNGGLSGVLSDIRQGRSRLDVADDLASFANLFENRWTEAEGKCDVAKADIDAAKSLSVRMMDAVNRRTGSIEAATWRLDRDRAGMYLFEGVRTLRLAATVVHQGDRDALKNYPALFSIQRPRRKEKESDAPSSPPATLVAAN